MQFSRIGVYDNDAGRALIQQHLYAAVGDDSNILQTYDDEYGHFQVRESVFAGPGGFLMLESTWQVSDSGLRLTSIIPKGGR